jgi:Domain of Unknown Function (DUF1080)
VAPGVALAASLVLLFDGSTLAGWRPSAASPHSAASGHRSGGVWRVEDGAILGAQDTPGNGGLLVSDAEFGDFEIELEAKVEWGLDSGIFLRAAADGSAYQVMVDCYPGGTVGGVYGEGLDGALDARLYSFGATPAGTPWRRDGWNAIRARIEGNPPRIRTWLNGAPIVDFTDTETRLAPRGRIALQVHGGGDTTGRFVRYRAIRVHTLD